MADERRMAQEARARLLSDPDAAAEAEAKAQEHTDQQTPAEAEGAFDPGPLLPSAPEQVEVEAAITPAGIVLTILVPWTGVVSYAPEPEADAPEA